MPDMAHVIKTDIEYRQALAEIDRLIDGDPPAGSADSERLQLLAVLAQDYESRQFPRKALDPLSAIRFRMEQQNLEQRDLIPYIGSRSKVSEVLSGKRALTLSMIKALNRAFGIPAEALLADSRHNLSEDVISWERFPIREMVSYGWISREPRHASPDAAELMRRFLKPLSQQGDLQKPAYALHKKTKVRSGRALDHYALTAWTWRVLILAKDIPDLSGYQHGTVNLEFMREVAGLSWSNRGPLLAQEFLARHGIALVVEKHLPKTCLDGAAILADRGAPVIGLTIRHDRLDNFWFCLMHELAHIDRHLREPADAFYDDLDVDDPDDPRETEADALAGEALIPQNIWDRSPAKNFRSPEAAIQLARQLKINPAIVAGRMRHEARNFRLLGNLVGRGEVRKLFTSVRWEGSDDGV